MDFSALPRYVSHPGDHAGGHCDRSDPYEELTLLPVAVFAGVIAVFLPPFFGGMLAGLYILLAGLHLLIPVLTVSLAFILLRSALRAILRRSWKLRPR